MKATRHTRPKYPKSPFWWKLKRARRPRYNTTMGRHRVHEWLNWARWVWAKLYLLRTVIQVTAYKNSAKARSVLCLFIVQFEETQVQAGLHWCVEWIIIAYLTESQRTAVFSFASNSKTTLRPTWEYSDFGCVLPLAELSAQESGCHPKTIFVRVALFQTFTVYYILQPPLFFRDGVSDSTLRFQWKALSCF